MAWQARLLSLSELKRDYFQSGKLTENTRYVSLCCMQEKKEELGGGEVF